MARRVPTHPAPTELTLSATLSLFPECPKLQSETPDAILGPVLILNYTSPKWLEVSFFNLRVFIHFPGYHPCLSAPRPAPCGVPDPQLLCACY